MSEAVERKIVASELRWGLVAFAVISVIMLAVIAAGVLMHINPPSNIEYADPKTLHLSGEFTEANLGTTVDPKGQVTARVVATQFAFVPRCIVLPAERRVTIRMASPDVI